MDTQSDGMSKQRYLPPQGNIHHSELMHVARANTQMAINKQHFATHVREEFLVHMQTIVAYKHQPRVAVGQMRLEQKPLHNQIRELPGSVLHLPVEVEEQEDTKHETPSQIMCARGDGNAGT